jgi:hypothetical protein
MRGLLCFGVLAVVLLAANGAEGDRGWLLHRGAAVQLLGDVRSGSATPGQDAGRQEIARWRGWDRYQAFMWSTGAPRDAAAWYARLKELGFTGEELGRGGDPEPLRRAGMTYYVENLVSELAHLHDRRALYDADFKGYTETRDPKYLVRKPCFDDPAFWVGQEKTLPELVRRYLGKEPLLYDLRDELSIGSFASPMDYCFCPHTLAAFREWLKGRYRSLAALNREWETEFGSWDGVRPFTTYEIKAREREALAAGKPENYAPWADHREYMDLSFARTLGRMREIIRRVDPTTPVGIEGTQMPSAWGGYDLWRLSQAIDWVEPYDIASSREIFRSFLPAKAPILATVFGNDFRHLRAELWRMLLHGDRGCIVWDDEQSRCIAKDQPGMPVTARGQGLAPVLKEIRAAAPWFIGKERIENGIAIHYSQPSIRAHWMFDSREDGDTWPRRFSSYEASNSKYARVRDSFVRVVEDLGFQYRFLSSEQIERGELAAPRFKVLLLPESVAMSKQECDRIRAFVRAGGTVVGDGMTAAMDEHCRRLPAGQLDDLFRAGERAVRLTLDMHGYGRDRLKPPGGEQVRETFSGLLTAAGVRPVVRVLGEDGKPAPCVEVWRYRIDGGEQVAIMRNPEASASSLGPVGYAGNEAIETPIRVRIALAGVAQVRDVRADKDLGRRGTVEAELSPWSPLVYEVRRGSNGN